MRFWLEEIFKRFRCAQRVCVVCTTTVTRLRSEFSVVNLVKMRDGKGGGVMRVAKILIGVLLFSVAGQAPAAHAQSASAQEENNLAFEVAVIKQHVSSGSGTNERSAIQDLSSVIDWGSGSIFSFTEGTLDAKKLN